MSDILIIDGQTVSSVVEVSENSDCTTITTVTGAVTLIEITSAGPQGIQGDVGPPGGMSGATGITTLLVITGSKTAASVYSTTSSGVNYTKSGGDGLFPDSAATFNVTTGITITLNGVIQNKGIQVVWISTTSFRLEMAVDNGDEILIIS